LQHLKYLLGKNFFIFIFLKKRKQNQNQNQKISRHALNDRLPPTEIEKKRDVYSFGLVIWECLYRTPVWEGNCFLFLFYIFWNQIN